MFEGSDGGGDEEAACINFAFFFFLLRFSFSFFSEKGTDKKSHAILPWFIF